MPEPYIGEIRMFGGNFAPAGWAFCQGQLLPISENDALFTLIGTTYGGDGQETFQLPNLASRVPIHMGTGPDGTTYTLGEAAGTEAETLTTQQMPIHSHNLLASGNTGTLSDPTNNMLCDSPNIKIYTAQVPSVSMANNIITPTGGSQPHENRQPYLVINFIISLFGVFPSQT
ncbi:MAG: tail fiber protein [Acidobacteria bacterium]|nr:tail fiber protein [Acidobacteriota bacterium]